MHADKGLLTMQVLAKSKYDEEFAEVLKRLGCIYGSQPMTSILDAVLRARNEDTHHEDETDYDEYISVEQVPGGVIR